MRHDLAAIPFLLLTGVAAAEPVAPAPESAPAVQTECQSCTARHKALQKLQEARVPSLSKSNGADEAEPLLAPAPSGDGSG